MSPRGTPPPLKLEAIPGLVILETFSHKSNLLITVMKSEPPFDLSYCIILAIVTGVKLPWELYTKNESIYYYANKKTLFQVCSISVKIMLVFTCVPQWGRELPFLQPRPQRLFKKGERGLALMSRMHALNCSYDALSPCMVFIPLPQLGKTRYVITSPS